MTSIDETKIPKIFPGSSGVVISENVYNTSQEQKEVKETLFEHVESPAARDSCDEMIKKYSKRITTKFITGWNLPIRHPNSFSSDGKISQDSEYLNTFFDYLVDETRSFPEETNNSDKDLYGVLIGVKPLALNDNDFFPEDPDKEIEREYFTRYMATHRCDIRSLDLTTDDGDVSTIWYRPKDWARAVFLYLFVGDMLGEDVKNAAKESKERQFDFWMGYLLGYSFESILLYDKIGSIYDEYLLLHPEYPKRPGLSINDFGDEKKTNEWNILYRKWETQITADINGMKYSDKLSLYTTLYSKYLEKYLTGESKRSFEELCAFIDKYIKEIEKDEKMELLARGPKMNNYIKKFGEHLIE